VGGGVEKKARNQPLCCHGKKKKEGKGPTASTKPIKERGGKERGLSRRGKVKKKKKLKLQGGRKKGRGKSPSPTVHRDPATQNSHEKMRKSPLKNREKLGAKIPRVTTKRGKSPVKREPPPRKKKKPRTAGPSPSRNKKKGGKNCCAEPLASPGGKREKKKKKILAGKRGKKKKKSSLGGPALGKQVTS